MDELLLLVFLMREKIAVVRFLEEQVLEGIVIFRTYLIGFHHMVVDICLGISEKLVRQILVGRKVPLSLTMNARFLSSETSRLL